MPRKDPFRERYGITMNAFRWLINTTDANEEMTKIFLYHIRNYPNVREGARIFHISPETYQGAYHAMKDFFFNHLEQNVKK
jgi:hypothetical protein